MLELSPLLTAAKAHGPLDAGLDQGVPVESDPGDLLAAEGRTQPPERCLVAVDDSDGVSEVLEAVREAGANSAASHDHDVHKHSLRGRVLGAIRGKPGGARTRYTPWAGWLTATVRLWGR